MARQESLTQFTGTIGNIIFYKSIDGYLARFKGGISAERIRTEPSFARTRENNAGFGRAVRASRLIRSAFRELLYKKCDPRVTGRLNGALVTVLRKDAVHNRGERTIRDGDISLLNGFNFNKNAKLSNTFLAPFTPAIDRASGRMKIDIPAFAPQKMIHAPDRSTHFRLKAAGAAMDFEAMEFKVATTEFNNLALTDEPHAPLQLDIALPPGSPATLVLILGIEFMQIVKSGDQQPLNDAAFNAIAIVATS